MSILSAMAFARDVAAATILASAVLAAYLAAFGVGGLTSGFAAALATVAASGLATVGAYGVAAALGAAPEAATPWIATASACAAIAIGGYLYGVRGLWVGGLIGVGLVFGAALIWVFGGRSDGWFGAAGPAVAMAALSLVVTAGLGATLRGMAQDPRFVDAPNLNGERSGATIDFWRPASVSFATPPDWFDCAYAALGGAAARPGLCAFNPPDVAEAPTTAGWLAAPRHADALPRADAPDQKEAAGPSMGAAPSTAWTPAAPAVDTPDFVSVLGVEDVAPPSPGRLGTAVAPAERSAAASDSPERASAPETVGAPAPMAGTTPEPSPHAFRDIETASIVPEASALRTPQEGAIELEPTVGRAEPARTELICFPMLGVLAEQLCPDQRLTVDDVDVSWRSPGGALVAGVDGVECYIDPEQRLAASFFIDLSEDLLGSMDRGRAPTDGKLRKIDAVYGAVTRLIGAARTPNAGLATDGDLSIAAYISSGSTLRSPWASQDFGPGRVDRLFDVRSSGQTLALLQRLKSETQALRAGARPPSFAAALADALATAPGMDTGAAQPIVMAFVDASLAQRIPPDEIEALRVTLAAYGAPVFIIELGSLAASETMRRIVEPTNGAAFGVNYAERLTEIFESALRRARSFCAVGVTAPETLFDDNVLEVRLRRRMVDGCQLEQVARVDCETVSLEQRIQPRAR